MCKTVVRDAISVPQSHSSGERVSAGTREQTGSILAQKGWEGACGRHHLGASVLAAPGTQ